ncbi:sodium/glutamate symporter [Luteimonas fraxinea]|uniref:sodium/glutamate symporter n=1 Tax=Luteimonas fraxinea TaxID=2901869 RepID=UPI001E491E8B|nr:sodium/glutamate symporter [Luteimonas fraxinea]MCD9126387.1 sodium/glutamate symporter [Luteimonas fraxinea]
MLMAAGADSVLAVDAFVSFTLAILLLFVGKGLTGRVALLRRYGIPEPVVGGTLCAAVVCALYYGAGLQVIFELGARDMLLLYFFAALGLNSNIRALALGGWALPILVLLASGFMVMQNGLGMVLAGLFGLDPRAGLMVGSVSLTGGVGTTVAWTPHFVETLGIAGAGELGLAANMIGLIAACVIGGPIASWLMRRHAVMPSADAGLEVGTLHGDATRNQLDYYGVLLALFWLNVALLLGQGVSALIATTGLHLPAFVGCLLAGITLRSLGDLFAPRGGRMWRYDTMQPGLALVSDISLGMFLTMALMGLQLWALQPMLLFIGTVMLLQVALVIVFTVFVVFRVMGRNYEAAVMCSAFGGITLGSTATAVANMSAVTREHGAAPRAFLIVPLVCGFFIDLINALVIGWMAG